MFEIMEYSSDPLSSRFPTRSISINNSKAIRHVSMLMNLGLAYEGLRFFDESYSMITDIQWADDSTTSRWTPMQGIPVNKHIVGFKCNTEGLSLHYISFLLGPIGHAEITSEINIPKLEVYPAFEQFEELYNGGSFQLEYIIFKNRGNSALSGLQFSFTNGVDSSFIATKGVEGSSEK